MKKILKNDPKNLRNFVTVNFLIYYNLNIRQDNNIFIFKITCLLSKIFNNYLIYNK